MQKTVDRVCMWEGFGDPDHNIFKWQSFCRIRVYQDGDRSVVVASDVEDYEQYPDGTGTSITNCVENLARMIADTFRLDPEQMTWIEHYPKSDGGRFHARDDEFSLVSLNYDLISHTFSRPQWKHITKEKAVELTGDEGLTE